MILALDTTAELGSLALLTPEGTLLEQTTLQAPEGFGHIIFQAIEALLTRHHLTLPQITLFAAASGPGSFTGVRVGLAAIKGLAESTGKPAAAISNLQALATFGTAPLRAPYIDARRGEIFGALYNANLELLQPETVMPFEAWQATLPPDAELIPADPARPLAAAIARLAKPQDPAALDANYVRRSDAEIFWKDPTARRPSSQST